MLLRPALICLFAASTCIGVLAASVDEKHPVVASYEKDPSILDRLDKVKLTMGDQSFQFTRVDGVEDARGLGVLLEVSGVDSIQLKEELLDFADIVEGLEKVVAILLSNETKPDLFFDGAKLDFNIFLKKYPNVALISLDDSYASVIRAINMPGWLQRFQDTGTIIRCNE